MKRKYYSDMDRLREMKDEEIDYSDIPETDEAFWEGAEMVFPPTRKKVLSIKLDEDLVEWFKALGKGYQERINEALRAYKETHG